MHRHATVAKYAISWQEELNNWSANEAVPEELNLGWGKVEKQTLSLPTGR